MSRAGKTVVLFIVLVLLIVLAGPLVIPLPPLTDTLPEKELADADSRFIDIDGVSVHYKQYGSGEPVMILMHGFGASVFSWRDVIQPLAEKGTVIAYDRPAFGLTVRPLPGEWGAVNPYSAEGNLNLLFGLMDALSVDKAILIGNSAGGRLGVQAALTRPERVQALVLVDAAIYTGGGNRFGLFAPFINTPHMDRLGPFFARSIAGEQGTQFINTAWHNPALITPEIEAGYRKPLQADNWDIALWQFTKAGSGSEDLAPRLAELTLPVLVVTGDDDRIVPTADSLRLAEDIPGAGLAVIPACGHVPHEECPQPFLDSVEPFITSLP